MPTVRSKTSSRKSAPVTYEEWCQEAYKLDRQGKHLAQISLIKHSNTWRLKNNFRANANHSWYLVGCAYFYLCKYEWAAKAFQKALRSQPEDGLAWWALGTSYSELGRYYSAYRAYVRGIRSEYNRKALPRLYYNLGNALFDMKKFDEAIVMYSKVQKRRDEIGGMARKNLKLSKEWALYLKEAQRPRSSRH